MPPLVVAGALAFVVFRSVEVKDRHPREAAVRARWENPADFDAVEKDVDAYVARFGSDPEARWFAAEAFAKIGRPGRAFDVVWDEPAISADRATPHRFARVMLRALGGTRETRTSLYPRCLLARVEGGDPGARESLEQMGLGMTPEEVLFYYKQANRSPTSAIPVLAKAWLSRTGEREFRLAGAALSAGDGKIASADLLVEMAGGEWKMAKRGAWQQLLLALGVSDDPRAVPTLTRIRDAVKGETEADGAERAAAEIALALARAPGAAQRVYDIGRSEPKWTWVLWLYGQGLVSRLFHGDAKALDEVLDLWKRDPGPETRFFIAYGCLLGDPPLPGGVPADDWTATILTHERSEETAVAHAYRFRVRTPGDRRPLDDLLKDLREAMHDPIAAHRIENGDSGPVFSEIECLRALFRWADR